MKHSFLVNKLSQRFPTLTNGGHLLSALAYGITHWRLSQWEIQVSRIRIRTDTEYAGIRPPLTTSHAFVRSNSQAKFSWLCHVPIYPPHHFGSLERTALTQELASLSCFGTYAFHRCSSGHPKICFSWWEFWEAVWAAVEVADCRSEVPQAYILILLCPRVLFFLLESTYNPKWGPSKLEGSFAVAPWRLSRALLAVTPNILA